MKINVKFIPPLDKMIEKSEKNLVIKTSRQTLLQLFQYLSDHYPRIHEIVCTSDNKLNQGIICVLNNELVIASELEKKILSNNDEIVFSIAIAGG
ncbi:MAG: MoaD/ThiS family protein [Candidatus Hodarchaeales archaeon]|jgi:molybdopterin converting factor small subunit